MTSGQPTTPGRLTVPGHPALAAASHGFLSPTGVEIAFLLVGLATLGAAVVTVTTRQLVHAALWLVVALGGLAVEYLLLTAEFIAWVQVLIYVGSVVVLLLFGLMLTRAPIGRSSDADSANRWAALTVAGAAAAALVWVVADAFRATWIDLDGPVQGSTAVSGESLFRHWVLPFEALSVLLLAALVGAIVLSRRRSRAAPGTPAAAARGAAVRPPAGPLVAGPASAGPVGTDPVSAGPASVGPAATAPAAPDQAAPPAPAERPADRSQPPHHADAPAGRGEPETGRGEPGADPGPGPGPRPDGVASGVAGSGPRTADRPAPADRPEAEAGGGPQSGVGRRAADVPGTADAPQPDSAGVDTGSDAGRDADTGADIGTGNDAGSDGRTDRGSGTGRGAGAAGGGRDAEGAEDRDGTEEKR